MFPACIDDISAHYQVPPALVTAISIVESGGRNVGKIENANGSFDLGVMQINTYWLKESTKNNVTRFGITEYELLNNDCTNVAVGAWILKQNLINTGNNLEAALSVYNTGRVKSAIGKKYAQKVIKIWRNLNAKNQIAGR